MPHQIENLSQILLIFQILTFLSAGIVIVAEDGPETTRRHRWGQPYVATLLAAAAAATVLNIVIRFL
jgi:hypothetical protein